jgi:hypothetical protein
MTLGDATGPGGEEGEPGARKASERAGGAEPRPRADGKGDRESRRAFENPAMKPEKDMSPWVPILVMVVLGAAIIAVSVMLTRMME